MHGLLLPRVCPGLQVKAFGARALSRATALVVVLAGLGCIGLASGSHAGPVKIRLGYSSAGDEQLWLLAVRPQLFARHYGEAYALEATMFPSSSVRAQAFEADALDLSAGGASGVMFAAAEGVAARIIASISRQSGTGFRVSWYVKADSPIKSIPDMKGKVIGINGFSTTGHLELVAALAKHGLTDADVTITPVPFPAMQQSLEAGKIDVGYFPQPYAALLENQMPVRKLFDSRYGMPFDQELIVLIGKDEFLKKNPAAIRALMEDLQASTRFYLEHPREARQALIDAKLVRVTPEVYMTMQDYYRDPSMRPSIEALEQTQDAMIKAGFQKKRADVRAMVDFSYLPN
jgi:ABC-type nitrate/sulfonate/bicarbonate transport system substrate-binding protein